MRPLCFVNTFHTSNTFLLEVGSNEWLVIDPGWLTNRLDEWIEQQQAHIAAIVLTHEHADHCAGVNKLMANQKVPLFCTTECKIGIASSKQNFSAYIDEIPTFEIDTPAIQVNDGQKIKLDDNDFTFLTTPGHSPGSMCIITGNSVFTGDTLLNNTKTPLNFPHSSKTDYAESMKKLNAVLQPQMKIYPGHGEPFELRNQNSFLINDYPFQRKQVNSLILKNNIIRI